MVEPLPPDCVPYLGSQHAVPLTELQEAESPAQLSFKFDDLVPAFTIRQNCSLNRWSTRRFHRLSRSAIVSSYVFATLELFTFSTGELGLISILNKLLPSRLTYTQTRAWNVL